MSDEAPLWNRAKPVFQAALERPPEERARFVRETCGDDHVLRHEVESLLSADDAVGDFAMRPAVEAFVASPASVSAQQSRADEGTVQPGSRLGPYEVVDHIGRGGMGDVYRARDTRLGRTVAIKVLPPHVAADADLRRRFEREARTLAALSHPHICAVFDVGHQDPSVGSGPAVDYLVMEYFDGETLAARLARGPLPLDEALHHAAQIAEALEAAHSIGVVHRDLKPGNIMLTGSGTKVLDFGLAKALGGDAPSPDLTHTTPMLATGEGWLLGTPAYMSPEQARGRPVDKRTDIWAYGCVLFEMLTGKQTFGAADAADTIAAIVREEPDWSALPAGTPAATRRLLRRALAKDARNRLGDASTARLEIADALTIPEGDASTATSPGPILRAGWARALPWVVAGVMTTTAAAALAGFLYARQPAAAEVVRFEMPAPEGAPFQSQIHISPNGRMIAFAATGGGDTRRRLWVRALDSLSARPLAGTEGTTDGLFWLPDSRTLVFSAGGKLKKIDVSGGPAQSICDFNSPVGGGFLTADNKIVFGTPATLGIQACPAGGGAATSITAFQPGGQERWHAFPSLLPDGRHFLFWRSAGPESGIYVGSLDAKPDEQTGTRVLPDASAPLYVADPDSDTGRLLFGRDGTLMAQGFDAGRLALTGDAVPVGEDLRNTNSYSASRDGTLVYLTAGASNVQLTWFDRQGETLGTVGRVGRPIGNMRISPDGTRLAANRSEPGAQPDIWVLDLVQGAETRLTTDPAPDGVAVWSPDGKRIAFASAREGTDNLYVRASDGAGRDELLLKTGEQKVPMDWSQDGRFLLFRVLTAKGSDIWVLPMDPAPGGERTPVRYLGTDANENNARFSPDGRFVAYTSDESGSMEFYVRPFDPASPETSGTGGGKVRVSPNGGGGVPLWELDGKALTYATPDRKRWAVDVTLTPALRVGAPRLRGEFPQGNAAVTPDGQRVLIGVPVDEQPPSAKLVLNWQAGLTQSAR